MNTYNVLRTALIPLVLAPGLPTIGHSEEFPMTVAILETLENQAPTVDPTRMSSTDVADREKGRRSLLVGVSRQNLSNGFGHWQDVGARGLYELGNHLLQGELSAQRHFDTSGTFASLGDTITLDPDWFTTLSVGAGDGAYYLPRYRLDGFINRKLLDDKSLIATLGAGYFRAPDTHTDRNFNIGATYYFTEPWIVQGEVRFNHSNPGSVNSHQQFLAVTWGREKQTYVTARHGWGAESYQAITGGQVLVNFQSRETSLAVRHWLTSEWGIEARAEKYSNPFFERKGITVAAFWQLP